MRKHSARAARLALTAATLGGVGFVTTLSASAANAADSSTAATATSPVVGYVYVNDNTTGVNTIAGFARHADASLSPLAGSPFVAGGTGSGVSLASQGAIQVTSDGKYILAVDNGSNQVSVLRVEQDGGLKLLPGGVVSSGGAAPVSVAVHDSLVYVANAGSANTNYTGFTLSSSGRLDALAGSTVPLPSNAQPGDVLFNGTGTNLIGTRVNTSQIDSFTVGSNGLLTEAPGGPINAQATGPFGSEFNPVDPNNLYVSNAHAGPGTGSVSAFNTATNGTLSSIGNSPYANGQSGTCWVEITPSGQFLFSVNTGSGTISRYQINSDGSLTLLGSTPVSSQAGVGAVDARLGPAGKDLWVDENRVDAIGVFAVDGGNLTQLPSTALPAGAAPAGIVVT